MSSTTSAAGEQELQVRSLSMYTVIVIVAAVLAVVALVVMSGGDAEPGPLETAPAYVASPPPAKEDIDEGLTERLYEAEASRDLGNVCLGQCNCLCYNRRTDGRIEPITVCRLNQTACLALEKKVNKKSTDDSSGRAVGGSVQVRCQEFDMVSINQRNGLRRSAWSPSTRSHGELFGMFYAGKCLLH